MLNPDRLRIARRRRKLSSKELAERTGISPVTLSRLERTKQEPSPATLEALSKALGFPQAFFLGSDLTELPVDAASFRSLSSITAKEREAALAAGALAYLFSDWICERFQLPAPDLPELSYEMEPETAARLLREYWGLGEQPISNMIKLLETKGVRVFSLVEDTNNVDAFSCWRDGIPYMFLNTQKSAEHRRHDATHELGHLILHKHAGPRNQSRQAEVEANAFASAFLMPRDDVRSRIVNVTSLNQLIPIKQRWGVSLASLVYRLHKVERITEWQFRSLFIQMNKLGYRKQEPDPMEPEVSVVWKKVFSQLWKERVTKDEIAKELLLPFEEVENLVFGLGEPHPCRQATDIREFNKISLKLV
jgi:Zn-dependent peptidase ImmA (M78 family)/DNA-binding Xre family transcriptional regulator